MFRAVPAIFLSALAVCLIAADPPKPASKKAPKAPPAKAAGKSALDKATLEAYVRHLFVMGPQIKVEVRDPKPSARLAGFLDVTVHASAGQAAQDFNFFVSKDGKTILQGAAYNIEQNPFKPELDKLKTEFQPSFGTPGAPVVLVAFSDFQCGYCKQLAKMLQENLVNAYPKQVRVYFKDFPLEGIHPWAKPASIAGRCVFRQNAAAFWKYHDWIFDKQTEITPENLKAKILDWAKDQKDLDTLQLTRCLDTKATEAEVDKNVAEGRALEINSTPTLFINGRRRPGAIDWPSLRAIIDYEIEYQKTARNAGEDCACDTKLPIPTAQ